MNKRDSFTEEELADPPSEVSDEEFEVIISPPVPRAPFVSGQHNVDCCGLVNFPLPKQGIYNFRGFSHINIPGELTIGQDEHHDLRLVYSGVEPTHAKLKLRDGTVYLKNLATTPGSTRLADVPLEGKAVLPMDVPFSIAGKTFCVQCIDPKHSPTVPNEENRPKRQRMDNIDDAKRKRVPSGYFIGSLFVIRGKTCYWLIRSQLNAVFRLGYSRDTFDRKLAKFLPSKRKCTTEESNLITSQAPFRNGARNFNLISLADCIQLLKKAGAVVPDYIDVLASHKFD